MSARQRIECPVCHKFLFDAFWVAERLSIITVCRCKRVVEVREDYTVVVLANQRTTHQTW